MDEKYYKEDDINIIHDHIDFSSYKTPIEEEEEEEYEEEEYEEGDINNTLAEDCQ